ncbi:MAG: hypothetical protein ACE5HC_10895 [Candidatus Binatia bacterium]
MLVHYEEKIKEEAVAEDRATFQDSNRAVFEVPKELLPARGGLITKLK